MSAVKSAAPPLPRRLGAELLGSGLLVTVAVGSGIAAESLSPDEVGLQLLENRVKLLFPDSPAAAGQAVIPHPTAITEKG